MKKETKCNYDDKRNIYIVICEGHSVTVNQVMMATVTLLK
jgi:hypothetical protein